MCEIAHRMTLSEGLWSSHSKMPFSQDSPFVSKKDLSRSFFIANFYTPNVVLFSVTFNTLLLVHGGGRRDMTIVISAVVEFQARGYKIRLVYLTEIEELDFIFFDITRFFYKL